MPYRLIHHFRTTVTSSRLAWVARGVIAVFLIAQIAPAGLRVTLDPPQTVLTQRPQMCVHTRLIEEVPEFRMQQTMRAIREMGVDTIVEFFPWAYVERSRGIDDWSQADKIFKYARNQGIKVYARFGLVPQWARPDDPEHPTTFNYLPEESFNDFAAYAARFTARYQDALAGVIIWNEPNLSFEWGFQPVDPIGYTKLLSVVSPAIRAVAPEIPILGGALSPTIAEGPEALDDLTYLRAMLDAGAGQYFDVLSAHTYGFGLPPDLPPDPESLNFRRIELLRMILDSYGLTRMPIAITESGWNDHPRWAQAVTPAERLTYTIDAYELARQQWPTVEKLCLWVFRFPAPINSYPDGYTLVSTDFDYKPLYYALQDYARGTGP